MGEITGRLQETLMTDIDGVLTKHKITTKRNLVCAECPEPMYMIHKQKEDICYSTVLGRPPVRYGRRPFPTCVYSTHSIPTRP